MNWNSMRTIFLKDWKELVRSRQVLLPMIIFPLLFAVAIPILISYVHPSEPWANAFLSGIAPERIPAGLSDDSLFSYIFLVYTFAPFFLAIPIMLASVITSTTFAGEKREKHLKDISTPPLTDMSLSFQRSLSRFFLPTFFQLRTLLSTQLS